ncbi:MAG: hypothetical protein AAFQ82_04835, partial [Myxococcota bacterium]
MKPVGQGGGVTLGELSTPTVPGPKPVTKTKAELWSSTSSMLPAPLEAALAQFGARSASTVGVRIGQGGSAATAADEVFPPTAVGAKLTAESRGHLLARVVLDQLPPTLADALDRYPSQDQGLAVALNLRCAGYPEAAGVGRIARRLSAAITWFDSPLGGQCKAGESLLSATQSTDVTRDARYHAPRSSRDGSLENHAFELLELVRPGLARELALFHPQIATTAQLNATADFARECRAEFGAFLANFNVFTCMHVMGRTPGLLKILTTELGLAPESYLGYSVAYSDSAVSRARSAIEGYDTRAYPKSTPAYTDRCKAALRAGLEEMASRSNENGKPMLIVDDTGYAAEVATELGIADRCKIVGWTKRTSWLFDAEESPRCAFVRGGESAPKTQWEPPLLAGGMADYVRCALNESFQQPDRAVVGIVGQGDIGAHLAAELGRRGHRVAVHDQDVAQCFRVRQHNVHNEADATAFTRTVDLFAGT